MDFLTPAEIKSVFNGFWQGQTASNTAMYGLGDIWEGPTGENEGEGTLSNNNTVFAIDTYKNNVYIAQGGISSWLKVITPDETKIYTLNSFAILLTNSGRAPYFSMTVINEDEVILGYLYLNLRHQYAAPFGLEMSDFYRNPSISISNIRVSSSSWITAIRDRSEWKIEINSKSGPDNCLPCELKKEATSTEFTCIDLEFSREANVMPGYRADAENGILSFSQGPGLSGMTRIPMPTMDAEKCMSSIDEYSSIFNRAKISPSDVGRVSAKISKSCSRAMYGNMVKSSAYKAKAKSMAEKYVEDLLANGEDNDKLYVEATKLTGMIGEMLFELSSSFGDNSFTKGLFRDTTWWAPIWFASNKTKLDLLEDGDNAYSLLFSVSLDDFIAILSAAASSAPTETEAQVEEMGWILVGNKGVTPVKLGKNNMSYFRFPFSECMSARKLFAIPDPFEIDGVCGAETRSNGIVVWGWRYGNPIAILKCFFMSNDGAYSKVGEFPLPEGFSPISGAAMAASDDDGTWIIRDFYLADFNDIQYVETTVDGGAEMKELKESDTVMNYGNINSSTTGVGMGHYYDDGLLDAHPGKHGLDDPPAAGGRAWGNDGRQMDWVTGYSGFQIKSADLL